MTSAKSPSIVTDTPDGSKHSKKASSPTEKKEVVAERYNNAAARHVILKLFVVFPLNYYNT